MMNPQASAYRVNPPFQQVELSSGGRSNRRNLPQMDMELKNIAYRTSGVVLNFIFEYGLLRGVVNRPRHSRPEGGVHSQGICRLLSHHSAKRRFNKPKNGRSKPQRTQRSQREAFKANLPALTRWVSETMAITLCFSSVYSVSSVANCFSQVKPLYEPIRADNYSRKKPENEQTRLFRQIPHHCLRAR